jgi:hypothetical protein
MSQTLAHRFTRRDYGGWNVHAAGRQVGHVYPNPDGTWTGFQRVPGSISAAQVTTRRTRALAAADVVTRAALAGDLDR